MSTENFSELPGNRLAYLNINGLQLTYVNTTTISIASGIARDGLDELDINSTSSLTLSTSFVGSGGLDTGTVTANSLYYVYLLDDQTNALVPNVIASLSTNPILPSVLGVTYSHSRFIGAFSTDGSSAIINFTMAGSSNDRYIELAQDISVLSAGNATTVTDVSLLNIVPSVNYKRVTLSAILAVGTVSQYAVINNFQFNGLSTTVATDLQLQVLPFLVSSVPNVKYFVSNSAAALTLLVGGYELSL